MGDNKPYDFYSPFVTAAILTRSGERIPLVAGVRNGAVLSAVNSDKSITFSSFPFLENLSIELNLAYMPKMSVTLTPPLRDGQRFLDSPLIEWGQSTLSAQFGYASGTPEGAKLSPVFEGLLLQPDVALGADTSITLNAQGFAGYNATVAQSSFTARKKKRITILQEVAAGFGKPLRDLKVTTKGVDKGSEADKLLEQEVDESQGYNTDWMFMTRIAKDAGCWIGLSTEDRSELKLFPLNSVLSSAPKFTLRFFDFVDGKFGPNHVNHTGASRAGGKELTHDTEVAGDFPILAVSSPSMSVWLPGATKALVLQGVDSSTGKIINRAITEENSGNSVNLGGGAAGVPADKNNPGLNPETKQGGAPVSRDVSFAESDAAAQQAFKFDMLTGIKLNITTLGIPDILPADIVAVRGVGARFDWNYGVFTVRHNIGASGFTTELELVSNTAAILGSVKEAQGKVNNESQAPAGVKVVAKPEPDVARNSFLLDRG